MRSVTSWKCVGAAARTIFILQKSNVVFLVMPFHEILIDTEFSMFKAASTCQPVINLVLCDKVLIPYFHRIRCRKFFLYHI